MKTAEEYIKDNGKYCRVCGSKDLGSLVDGEGRVTSQEVFCNSCGASWHDVLRIIGISGLEHGKLVVNIMLGGNVVRKNLVTEFSAGGEEDCVGRLIGVDTTGCPNTDRLYLEDQFGYRYKWWITNNEGRQTVFVKI